MDVHIDTEEIVEGIESISSIISNLEMITGVMNGKLSSAGEEFTSINFERAAVNVNLASQSLDTMNEKLEITKTYLNKLVGQVEMYHKFKF